MNTNNDVPGHIEETKKEFPTVDFSFFEGMERPELWFLETLDPEVQAYLTTNVHDSETDPLGKNYFEVLMKMRTQFSHPSFIPMKPRAIEST